MKRLWMLTVALYLAGCSAQRQIPEEAQAPQPAATLVPTATRAATPLPTATQVAAANQDTEITLRRTWCYGQCPVDELVINGNGTVKYTGKMNSVRTGHYKGAIWNGEVKHLLRWIEAEGFFRLKDSYGWPNADLPDHIISIVRGGRRKTVVNHSLHSLLKLWGIEKAVRGVTSDMVWQPEPSGIRGVATWRPKTSPGSPVPAFRAMSGITVSIRPANDKEAFRLSPDKNGKFHIPLLPGVYSVSTAIYAREFKETVTVQPDAFIDLTIKLDRSTG